MMKQRVRVLVPATTANLGPGFDVLGAALDLHNEIAVTRQGNGGELRIEIEGEGREELPRDGRNIVWRSMERVFGELKDKKLRAALLKGSYALRLVNRVPLVSGLGSSAAARLGGILAANEIAGRPLSREEILSLGVEMEGHPDNLVPALAGGLCTCVKDGKRVRFIKLSAPKLKAVVCTPDFALATESARKVLPAHLPLSSVVFNCSRLALLVAALQTGRYEHLAEAMEDCLHQPSREPLVPGMARVLEAARAAGAYGAALSGAGPSLVALCSPSRAKRVALAMKDKWLQGGVNSRFFILDFDPRGARITYSR